MQLIDNVDDIEFNLSKLVATTSFDSQKTIMQSLYTSCVLASENMDSLPISNQSLSYVNKLVNKVGGYVYSLLMAEKVVEGDDLQSIEELHRSISVIKYDLNKGYSSFVDNGDYLTESTLEEDGSSFTAGLVSGDDSYGDVPSLIYDGPFSESVLNKEQKVLEDKISQEESARLIEQFVGYWQGYDIKYDGVTNGKLVTFNYILSGESEIYVQILQNGGKLLSATSYGDYVGDLVSTEDAIAMARRIAYDFGFQDMISVWHQVVQDIVYINLAPRIDGVVYYSDLVKVKIDLNGGGLVGFEATNYIYNHYDRPAYSNAISISEAQLLLSESLNVLERSYCVVPNEYVGETNAIEFVCEWSGYTYYIYLDADTGQELKIMRVIETDNGELLE